MLAKLSQNGTWSLEIDGVPKENEIIASGNTALMALMYRSPGDNLAPLITELKLAYPAITQVQATFGV